MKDDETPRGELATAARAAAGNAYAPYSGFEVGAAVIDDRQEIFVGSNVENASYGLSMCAERVAIFNAIAAGAERIEAVAVWTKDYRSANFTPCGACRQVFAEFMDDEALVLIQGKSERTLRDLLPEAFEMERNEGD